MFEFGSLSIALNNIGLGAVHTEHVFAFLGLYFISFFLMYTECRAMLLFPCLAYEMRIFNAW